MYQIVDMVGYQILLMGLILPIIIIIIGIKIIIMGIMDTTDIITKALIRFLRKITITIMEGIIIAHINIMGIMVMVMVMVIMVMVIMAIDIKLSYSFVLYTFFLKNIHIWIYLQLFILTYNFIFTLLYNNKHILIYILIYK